MHLIWVNTGSRQSSILLLTQTARGDPMRAIDVMTSEVISVDEDATVPAVARLLAERGISVVPVVDKDASLLWFPLSSSIAEVKPPKTLSTSPLGYRKWRVV
jgi:CBS domain-containing protein